MASTATRIDLAKSCEKTIGYDAGDYGMQRIRCGQVVGLTRWYDETGVPHAACSIDGHRSDVEHRYPPASPLIVAARDGDR